MRDAGGVPAAAEALVARIVRLNPNHIAATHDLALRLLRRGALAEAEEHGRNAVRIAPEDRQSHNLLGMILTEAHQPATGEFHYRRVLALAEAAGDARDPILLANLAWCLKLQGRVDEARALYHESTAAAPDVPQTLLGWARLEEADRDFAAAGRLLDRAEQLMPWGSSTGAASIRLLRAVLHGRRGEPAAALAVLDRLAADRLDAGGGDGLAPEELLEQGRLLDRSGRHADAFAAFDQARRRMREVGGQAYAADHAAALAARLRRFFTAARLALLPRAGLRTDCAQPIFIVGFPRSGTTLTEQSLTAHPLIAAGDELPFISETAELMPRLLGSPLAYPEALADLWLGDRHEGLDTLRDHYLQRARQRGVMAPGAAWFTDKMPLNEFHLGLIGLLFPASPIIHVLRHPLDVMLSVFSNQLTHGFNCALSLDSAATHYALTAELVAQYRAECGLRYTTVRYEDIVTDQEAQIRRLLDFVGVAFDPACLSPHENRRYARTASYAQVTERLYDRSRARWRNYRAELAPVVDILRPAMETAWLWAERR